MQANPEILLISIGKDNQTLLALCYCSPNTGDIFSDLQTCIINAPVHTNTIILGDFNASIGETNIVFNSLKTSNQFDVLNHRDSSIELVSFPRSSEDKKLNKRGKECLSFCDTTEMVVLNGHAKGDEIGKYTFTSRANGGSSVVDLCMINKDSLKQVQDMTVHPMSEFHLSDHNMLTLSVSLCPMLITPRKVSPPKCL